MSASSNMSLSQIRPKIKIEKKTNINSTNSNESLNSDETPSSNIWSHNLPLNCYYIIGSKASGDYFEYANKETKVIIRSGSSKDINIYEKYKELTKTLGERNLLRWSDPLLDKLSTGGQYLGFMQIDSNELLII